MIEIKESNGWIYFESNGSAISEIRVLNQIQNTLVNNARDTNLRVNNPREFSIAVSLFMTRYHNLMDIIEQEFESFKIDESFFEFVNFADGILDNPENNNRESLDESGVNNALEEAGWDFTLRPPSDFQIRNLVAMSRFNNAAFFSVPGAGKTVEALAFSCLIGGNAPKKLLVVSPRNAYISWETELEACLGISGKDIFRAVGLDDELQTRLIANEPPDVVLINYNRLWTRNSFFEDYMRSLRSKGFNPIMILDESHHFKGGRAFTTSVLQLAPLANHRIILSGTPMPRDEDDLVPQFQALLPMHIPDIDAASIVEFSRDRFARTTKDDLQLRRPNINYVPVEMTPLQRMIYRILTDFASREIVSRGSVRALAGLGRMNRIMMYLLMHVSNPQLTASEVVSYLEGVNPEVVEQINQAIQGHSISEPSHGPKIDQAIQMARTLVESGEKVVIWTSFVHNVEYIASELEDLGAVFIHGGISTASDVFEQHSELFENGDLPFEEERNREQVISMFKDQNADCSILVANPASAGEGISLHDVCHHAIYVDRTFDATKFMQSMDRIHRYGLDSDGNVICANIDTHIHILYCPNSVDLAVHQNLTRKIVRMYEWLNDPSLNPGLRILEPSITENEIDWILNPDNCPLPNPDDWGH